MLKVYGVVPSDLISSGHPVAEFPSFTGRSVGGVIPVDCRVSIVELSTSAASSAANWCWSPVNRGFVVLINQKPFSVLKNHLRRIRYLQDELGQYRVWPWFDPRYLRLALNTLEGADLNLIFGPIQAFGFHTLHSTGHCIELYQINADGLQIKRASA